MSDTTQTRSPFAEAVTAYLAALREAAAFTDPDLNATAAARRREAMAVEAHRALRSTLDSLPAPGSDPRDRVLDGLRASTADEVAVQGREREKVEALLRAGKPLGQIIADADAVRVAAILDHLEVMPDVLNNDQPTAMIAEVRALVFDRLAEVEQPDAVAAAAAHRDWATATAQRDVLESITRGTVSMGALTALHRADPDSYRAAAEVHEVATLVAEAPAAARRAEHAA